VANKIVLLLAVDLITKFKQIFMKKLLLFLVMASFAVLGTACSSDDSESGSNKVLALFSDADEDGIVQGTTVEFTAMIEKGGDVVVIEEGVSFFVGSTEVKNPYTFNEVGEFKVVAKKKGYKESNTLIIKVIEGNIVGPGDKGKLIISVVGGVTEVEVGDNVKFDVKDQEGINVTTASIMLSDETHIGYSWTPPAAGTYKIFAFKYGYEKSEGIIVTVKDKVEKKLVLALEGNANELYVNERFRLMIKDGNGAAVANAILHKNGTPTAMTSVNGVFDVTLDAAGTYALKAVQEGVESNVVNVTVKKKETVANSFDFRGSNYSIAQSTLVFSGIDTIDEAGTEYAAFWQIEGAEVGGKIAIIMFYTPAYPAGGTSFSYERPTATNTTAYAAGVVQNTNVLAATNENVGFLFNAVPSSNMFVGAYNGSALNLGGSSFRMNFNGLTQYLDVTGLQGVRGVRTAEVGQGNPTIKVDRSMKVTKTLRVWSK